MVWHTRQSVLESNKVFIDKTKKGYLAAWECGGGMTNTGRAVIVCGPAGEKLKPVYYRRRGHLACNEHGLFILKPGYHLIFANHHRGDFHIDVQKIVSLHADNEKPYALVELVCNFSKGEWDKEPPEELKPAIEAAKAKARCYHCRNLHYAKMED